MRNLEELHKDLDTVSKKLEQFKSCLRYHLNENGIAHIDECIENIRDIRDKSWEMKKNIIQKRHEMERAIRDIEGN